MLDQRNCLGKIESALANNQIAQAAELTTNCLREFPGNGELWYFLSVISTKTGKMKVAINSALKAIDCSPQEPKYYFALAGCYLQIQLFEPAKKALEHCRTLLSENSDSQDWDKLGELFYRSSELEKAIEAHQMAIKVNPESYSSMNQLAALLRFEGKIEQAEELYIQVLKLHPANAQACYNLSQLRRYTEASTQIELFKNCKSLLDKDINGQIQIQYALGKVYEDSGNFEQSLQSYMAGAQIKRQQSPYTAERDQKFMQTVISYFENLHLELPEPPTSTQQPVFVVGLPRTGTTLVERILASHPAVVSGDELNALPMALLEAGGKSLAAGMDGLDDIWVSNVNPENFPAIGKRYLELASNYVGDANIFVDKLPYNFLYCGFILHALPNARIVHVNRNPFDAAVSNFKMLFNRGYEYSYTWKDIASFISNYKNLMNSWQELFPGKIFELNYEALVEDQEGVTRKLLEYTGLDWNEACLNFHQNKTATHTASASQVREPLHSRSIGYWRNYEPMLPELINEFANYGIHPDERY